MICQCCGIPRIKLKIDPDIDDPADKYADCCQCTENIGFGGSGLVHIPKITGLAREYRCKGPPWVTLIVRCVCDVEYEIDIPESGHIKVKDCTTPGCKGRLKVDRDPGIIVNPPE